MSGFWDRVKAVLRAMCIGMCRGLGLDIIIGMCIYTEFCGLNEDKKPTNKNRKCKRGERVIKELSGLFLSVEASDTLLNGTFSTLKRWRLVAKVVHWVLFTTCH